MGLQDGAAALFSERIDLLARKANEQAIFLLVFGDVFHDVGHRLSYWHPLNGSFATQLLRHHPKTNNKRINLICDFRNTNILYQ
jgi:hypothetical protein